MKRTLLILALASFSFIATAQTNGEIIDPAVYPVEPQDTIKPEVQSDIFHVVEKMPSWGSCDTSKRTNEIDMCTREHFDEYIKQNMRYPAFCKDMRIEGVVYLSCVIEKDGSITNVLVLRSVQKDIDVEAVRLIQEMPNWNPGEQRGKPVRVSFKFPVRFRLSQ